MKTFRLFFCGALLLLIGSASLSAQTNLIPNGGFETLGDDGNPTGWVDMGTWDWVFPGTSSKLNLLSDTNVPDGIGSSKSGKFIFHDGPNNNIYPQDWPMILTDKIPEGAIFDISFWIKGGPIVNSDVKNAGYNVAIETSMFENYANLPPTYTDKTELIEGEWINLTYEGITSQTTAAQPWFALVLTVANNQYFWLDDVKITLHDSQETTTNLIPNGNFEQVDANGKPTGWGDKYAADYESVVSNYNTSDATDFKEGIKSGFFTHEPGLNLENVVPGVQAMNWIKSIPADKTYNISFWYKVSDKLNQTYSDHEPGMSLGQSSFYNGLSSENRAILGTGLDIMTGEWLFGEYKGIKSTKAAEDFIIVFSSDNCNFWLDDVQMVEATETGIADVKVDTKLPVYVSEGILYVGGTTAGETVSVYSITGQTLKSETAQSATTKITGLSRGQVYIVRCGSKSAKVVL